MKTAIVAMLLATVLPITAHAQFAEPVPARGENSRCWEWHPDDDNHVYVCPRTPAQQSFVRGNDKTATAIAQDAMLRQAWSSQYPTYTSTRTIYYWYTYRRGYSGSTYYTGGPYGNPYASAIRR